MPDLDICGRTHDAAIVGSRRNPAYTLAIQETGSPRADAADTGALHHRKGLAFEMRKQSTTTPAATKKTRGKRGEGSVYLDKRSGIWTATIPLGAGRKPLLYTGKTEAEARQARDVARLAHHTGTISLYEFGESAQKTVGDLLTYWYESEIKPRYDKSGEQAYGREITTDVNYEQVIRLHILPYPLARVRLDQLRPSHIKSWLIDMLERGVGAPTQVAAMRRLRTCLKFGMTQQVGLQSNPALGVRPPRHKARRYPAPNEADISRLVTVALEHERWGRMIPLTLICGLRKQEAVALQWSDVDWDARRLMIRRRATTVKGQVKVRSGVKMHADAEQSISLSSEAIELLRAQRTYLSSVRLDLASATSLCFPSLAGTVLHYGSFDRWFQAVCQRAGVTHTFHQLRHDCAGLMLNSGRQLIEVSRHLRHQRLETTANVYAHLMAEQHTDAAASIGAAVGRLMALPAHSASA